jgi:TetR/AcrR family transcriptional regulator, transcriptional repressor for nem operon
MASPRRVGTETSKTRDLLLDCVERLMVKSGYASVTYRAVAAAAGVTSGLVQYYFPSQDELFAAVIRRRSQQNIDRLTDALREDADEPLRVLWEYSQDESVAALTTEFLALGNHSTSIKEVIAEVSERVRGLQLQVLHARFGAEGIDLGRLSPEAFLFLLTGTPKLIRLEQGVGISTTHAEAVTAFEDFLDTAEPRASRSKTTPKVVAGTKSKPKARTRKTPSGS